MAILKNSILNVAGSLLPAVIAFPAYGYMARELGVFYFGITLLILAVVGYASIFDIGIGKSVVRYISLNENNSAYIHERTLGTSLLFVSMMGLIVCIALYFSSEFIAETIFKTEPDKLNVVIEATRIASFCVPIYLVFIILQSYFEGTEQFGVFNIIRSLVGSLTFIFPCVFLYFYHDLRFLVLGLLVARLVSLLAIFFLILNYVKIREFKFDFIILKDLFSFGGWLTITNIISPLMVYMDKILVSKVVGAHDAAFYAAPSELVNKMSVVPVAITRALFPRLSALQGREDYDYVKKQAYIYMLVISIPVAILGCILAPLGIELWLGERFVDTSAVALQIMLIGFVFNSISLISYTSLQSKGHAYITAKVHLLEVAPYLIGLYFSCAYFGVKGAAVVWTVRMVVDMFLMTWFDKRV